MPTGYTSDLYEGIDQTFEEFVLTCARAFGATIMQRDDPMDAPLRLPTYDGFSQKWLDQDNERLAELNAMSADEAAEAAANAYEEAKRRREESIAKNAAMRTRYEAMLAQVKGWSPPTSEHDNLKHFMIDQLEESIRFDCSYAPSVPERLTGHEWLRQEIVAVQRNIERHTEQIEKDIANTEGRRKWITDLANSIGVEVVGDEVVPA